MQLGLRARDEYSAPISAGGQNANRWNRSAGREASYLHLEKCCRTLTIEIRNVSSRSAVGQNIGDE